MKRIILALILLSSTAYAEEVLTDFKDESLPVINELLRKSNESVDALEARVTALETSGTTFATQALMEAASSNTVAVTPGRQVYHPLMPKAVCSFDGTGTPAMIYNSGFSSTITDNGTGDYTLTLSTAMSSSNYAIVTGINRDGTAGSASVTAKILTSSTIRIFTTNSVDAAIDPQFVSVAVFGDT